MQDLIFEISNNGLIIPQYMLFVNKFPQKNNFFQKKHCKIYISPSSYQAFKIKKSTDRSLWIFY